MKFLKWSGVIVALSTILSAPQALADNNTATADSHAPIGVMGDHMHAKGEWMVSYRFMHMGMAGSRVNSNSISPDTIATTIPNRFFGTPMQPPTLRVVPLRMDMDMHMFGLMYAPTDWLTLMAMGMYVSLDMDHVTYQGPMGTGTIGEFTTKSDGIGDSSLTGLIRLYETETAHIHLHAGMGFPTGSNTSTDDVLTPMNTTPTLRLPYAMQIGSGTYDLRPGLTYTANQGRLGWGLQYTGIIRIGADEGYRLGDVHKITGWTSYRIQPWLSASVRLEGETRGKVSGMDPLIVAPVQTADPLNYGGETLNSFLGFNVIAPHGFAEGHRLALEVGLPLVRNLNGPQMETDWQITIGWQKSF